MKFSRVIAALALVAACCSQADAARITFVLVNDIYNMSAQTSADGKVRGGFARLATVVKTEREKGNVIFAHAGDTLSPSLMSGLDRGAHVVALTNMIRPDVFVPGNHEFDFGKATFLQRMAEARFPLYAANLRGPDGAALPGFKDAAIVTIDGVRVGIVGATYDDTPRTSTPEDLKFAPTVDTVKAQADALRRDGADFVVAVVHASRGQDYALMALRTVDLVLSGHDHDLFVNYDGRNAIVESSYDAHYAVAVDVEISVAERAGRREATWWPNFRIVDTATVAPDPEVEAAVNGFERVLARQMDATLATTAVELDSRNATVRTREAAIGDLIADAMRETTGADVAIMNGGGIRAGKVYAPGATLTRRDVLAEVPFGNRLMRLEVSGRALRAALENGLAALPQAAGRFPQIAGVTLDVDASRAPGMRIVDIKIGGAPLDPEKTYSLATNDFLARGGDGYTMLRDANRLLPEDDSPLLAFEVMNYLQRIGTVRTQVDRRIVLR